MTNYQLFHQLERKPSHADLFYKLRKSPLRRALDWLLWRLGL